MNTDNTDFTAPMTVAMTDDLHWPETFLPASSPWLARRFADAYQLIGDLEIAASLQDFVPACIDDQALAGLVERFSKASSALPSVYDDRNNPPPLELEVLKRCLYLLEDFLKLEQERRKEDPSYAAECKGANEVKKYREEHNGAWPPAVRGGTELTQLNSQQ